MSESDNNTDNSTVSVEDESTNRYPKNVTVPQNDEKFEAGPNSPKHLNGEMVDIPVDEDVKSKDDATSAPELSGNITVNKNIDLSERMKNFKSWGFNTFMRTKQKVKEKLNRTSKTLDANVEDRIDMLRVQKNQYSLMVANNNRTIEQLRQFTLIHQCTARMNSELSQTERTLSESLLFQSQTEVGALTHIKDLINKLVCSNETLDTLVNKTYGDLYLTIQSYETARVELDAYKTETTRLENQLQLKNESKTSANDHLKLQEIQENLEQKRLRYESIKDTVLTKIDLLEDHKNRVIEREMLNYRHAWFNYYSQCADLFSDTKWQFQGSLSKSEDEESCDK